MPSSFAPQLKVPLYRDCGTRLLSLGVSFAQHYTRTDLTTDSSSVSAAPNMDPNLVNARNSGLQTTPGTMLTDNGTGLIKAV